MDRETIKQFYQKYRVIIFPVVTAIGSLILIGLVIFPQISKLLSNNKSYNELQKQNQFLEVKASELESIDESDLKQKLDLSLAALPAGRDFTEIMALVQSIVAESGFILNSLQFGSAVPGKEANGYTVTLDVTGSKVALSGLLNNLESTYRPMKVNNVDVSLSKTDENINGVITVDVFYEPIPQSVGKIDAPVPRLSSAEEQIMEKLLQTTSLTSSEQSPPVVTSGKADPFE